MGERRVKRDEEREKGRKRGRVGERRVKREREERERGREGGGGGERKQVCMAMCKTACCS